MSPEFRPTLPEIISKVEGLARKSLILIDGASGTGKTTLAEIIARQTNALSPISLVHMDDLYPGWAGLEQGIHNLDEWILLPRLRGQRIRYQRYDWVAGQFRDDVEIDSEHTLVVEGCGGLGSVATEFADLTMWLATDEEVRRSRALARNPAEDFDAHWSSWDAQFDAYVQREQPHHRASIHVRSLG